MAGPDGPPFPNKITTQRGWTHFGEWENFPGNCGCCYFLFRLFLTSLNFAMMVALWNEFQFKGVFGVIKRPGQFRCWSPKNLFRSIFSIILPILTEPLLYSKTLLESNTTSEQGELAAPGGCPCHPCVWAASVQPPACATMRANSAFMWLDLWWVRCQEWPELQ